MDSHYTNKNYYIISGVSKVVKPGADIYLVINGSTEQVELEEFFLPRAIDYANQLSEALETDEPVVIAYDFGSEESPLQ